VRGVSDYILETEYSDHDEDDTYEHRYVFLLENLAKDMGKNTGGGKRFLR